MTDAVHPREVFHLEGQEAAEAAFVDAMARGRLHHAWMLTGAEGVGKATFAYRAARRLLGAPPEPAYGLLGADPQHPVSRQVMARAHPDLLVIEREGPDGKPRKVIPVDDVRQLGEFFSKTPATAPFRVAIIDAADDLNINSANALLKPLEEPPAKGVLLMVAHAPGRILPTIRSRCRRLAFEAMSLEACAAFVQDRTAVDTETALRLARMAGGAPGMALQLASGPALSLDDAARDLLANLPDVDEALALSVADRFRGADGMGVFNLMIDRLSARSHALATDRAQAGQGSLAGWAEAWDSLQRLRRDVEAVNLDRADAFFTALGELRRAARA